MAKFRKVKRLSSWRKISLHTWHDVGDPSVYGTMEIDMGAALSYLQRLRDKSGVHVTVTHLGVKAVADAIAQCPQINGIVLGQNIYERDTIDIFALVAIDGGSDLTGAKIREADKKSVVEIAQELNERAAKLRRHQDKEVGPTQLMLKLLPNFLVGPALRLISAVSYDWDLDLHRLGIPYDQFGSAIVTSFGMFGLSQGFAPLVPFAHTGLLLSVGEVEERPRVVDGAVTARPMITLGATFDHRLIDGFQAGVLARHGRAVIEDPVKYLGEP